MSGAIVIFKIISFIALVIVIVLIGGAIWYYSPVWLKWHWDADAAAIYITGSAAAVVGVWALFSQRIIARRQCTFEHIAQSEADHDLIQGRIRFRELTKTPGALKSLAMQEKTDQTADFQTVITRLNWFELVSIGIQRGSLDFVFYSLWLKTGTIRTWKEAEEFIKEIRRREHNDMIYYEFERLVGWLSSDSQPTRSRWWGVFF